MSKFTLAAILALAAANAVAASNPETVFACTLQNGKRVDIRYQAAKGARAATVLYRYGANLARPEIAFSQPAEQVYYTQMQGAVWNVRTMKAARSRKAECPCTSCI